jgi:uncharacterized membrane protein
MLAGGFLFWGCIICLIAWGIYRTTKHQGDAQHFGESPLDHLKERHAKSEITKEQFEEIRRDLMS